MASFEDQTRRLERAKRQYELMLLHYSDDFIDEQLSPTTSANHAATAPITPMSERFQHKGIQLFYFCMNSKVTCPFHMLTKYHLRRRLCRTLLSRYLLAIKT